jgi:hypothetical protein
MDRGKHDVSHSCVEPHVLGPAKELLDGPNEKKDHVVGERKRLAPERALGAHQTAIASFVRGKRRIAARERRQRTDREER